MLTGTLKARTKLVMNPTCPSLIKKISFFRSADRNENGFAATGGYRVRISIASSSSSSRPTGLRVCYSVLSPDCIEVVM